MIDVYETLESLKEQTLLQNEIGDSYERAVRPLIPELDAKLRTLYKREKLDTIALSDLFHNPLTGFNEKAKERLFPLAFGFEKKIRAQWETIGLSFDSPATEFFQSVTARSLYVFAQWFVGIVHYEHSQNRAFRCVSLLNELPESRRDYYYIDGVRVFKNFSKKRVSGETRGKIFRSKAKGIAKEAFDIEKMFDDALADVLKQYDDLPDSLPAKEFLKPAREGNQFTLLGKSVEAASKQPNNFIVRNLDTGGNTIGIYRMQTERDFE